MTPWVVAGAVAAALAGAALAAEPGAQRFVAGPGSFAVTRAGGTTALAVQDGTGRETARYDLGACSICAGPEGACTGEGAFEMNFPGAAAPMIGASCRGADGRHRFLVFDPDRDPRAPVFDAPGARHAVYPDRIEVIGEDGAARIWQPAVAADADEIAWVLASMEAAGARRVEAPQRSDDPELRDLLMRLREISGSRDAEALVAMAAPDVLTSFGGDGTRDELRLLIAEPWFWDEFARVLAGGGVVVPNPEGPGRMAVFPAAFGEWPDDLDAFSYLYGDREGGVLRAGPSDRAPALMPLQGRILARGPVLEHDDALRDAGWIYLCTAAVGCGYARDGDARSPIDHRAVFTRDAAAPAWRLESFVAGD